MRQLILYRHAKSSWAQAGLDDHERPLNERGRTAAVAMGVYLATNDLAPDHVIISSSLRTQDTWRRTAGAVGSSAPDAIIEPRLYHADPEEMLAVARTAPAKANRLMLVAHEPGVSAMARMLSDGKEGPDCRRAYTKYPTGAMAFFDVDLDGWGKLTFGAAKFTAFVAPKDLL